MGASGRDLASSTQPFSQLYSECLPGQGNPSIPTIRWVCGVHVGIITGSHQTIPSRDAPPFKIHFGQLLDPGCYGLTVCRDTESQERLLPQLQGLLLHLVLCHEPIERSDLALPGTAGAGSYGHLQHLCPTLSGSRSFTPKSAARAVGRWVHLCRRRLLGGTWSPRADEPPNRTAQELHPACTTMLCFLLPGFVSSLYFSIYMCAPPQRVPTIPSNDFWPLYNTRHQRFPDEIRLWILQAGTGGGKRQHVAQGRPTRSLPVRGTTLQMGPSSYRIQPPPLWMLGHILHLDFTSLGRRKPELALAPPSQNSSSRSLTSPTAPFPPFPFGTFSSRH